MFKKIGVPVDLSHPEKVEKALKVAADLGRNYDAELYLVAVTSSAPSDVAHNPDEFRDKLLQFAEDWSASESVQFAPDMQVTRDPSVELDHVLDKRFHELGIDLVVMASHVPGFREYIFSSKAGLLAAHTDLSVLVVR